MPLIDTSIVDALASDIGFQFADTGLTTQAPAPADAGVVYVSDAAELADALASATGGETIMLAAGDYGTLAITGDYGAGITLRAEDPGTVRVTRLDVDNAAGVALEGFFFDYDYAEGDPNFRTYFTVSESQDIVLRDCLFEGDDMEGTGTAGDGYPAGRGLKISSSTDVLIEGCEITNFWKGLGVGGSENVVIRGSDFHDIRSDGINITSSDGVLIEDNYIHDFRANAATGDHADMIQVYSGSSAQIPSNITVRNNVLNIGDGDSTQSIWITHNSTAQATHGDDVAFENITVTDNVIINGRIQGIVVGNTNGATVTNNTVIAPAGTTMPEPRIGIDSGSTDVVFENNIMHSYYYAPGEDWDLSSNLMVQKDNPEIENHYETVFVNAMSDSTVVENLQVLPDSAAAAAGVGAAQLQYNATPENLTALVQPSTGEWLNAVNFDASLSAGPNGMDGALFHWDFGDGTSAEGMVVGHRYADAGIYEATLTVTLPDGSSDTTMVLTEVAGSHLINLDAAEGVLTVTAFNDVLSSLVVTDLATAIVPGSPSVMAPVGAEAAAPGGAQAAAPGGVEAAAPDSAQTAEAASIHFDADTMLQFDDTVVDMLESADSFSISARVRADAAGNLVNLHTAIDFEITSSGELWTKVMGTKLSTKGVDMLDGNWHDIELNLDINKGDKALTIVVDGVEVASSAAPYALAAEINYDFKIGAQKASGDGFVGEMENFDLDVNPALYNLTPEPQDAPQGAPVPVAPVVPSLMEVGTVTLTQADSGTWSSITFADQIENARVIMGPVSFEGGEAATVRVRNVTDTGFEFQIDEWDYLDGAHIEETVSWIAGPEGSYVMDSGETITFGQSSLTNEDPVTVTLDGMSSDVAIFAQVSSAQEADAVTTRISGVTGDAFSVRMQEQDSSSGSHATETVDWMAIDSAGSVATLSADHTGTTLHPTVDTFAFLAAAQTENGSDAMTLRYDDLGDNGISVIVQEEASDDTELSHYLEDVAVLMLDQGQYDLYDLFAL